MKPRIIVFTTAYHPFVGGAEIAIEEIAKRLRNDFDFFIITARMDRSLHSQEIRPEGTVFRVGFGNKFDKWLLLFFGVVRGWYLVRKNPDNTLFFGLDISQGSLAASVLARFFPRTPFLLNIQYGYGGERLEKKRGGMIRRSFRVMLRRADYVTAISRSLATLAREYGYQGIVSVIHNGVAFEQFFSPDTISQKKAPVVITTSRLIPKNGIDILIAAVAETKKKIPELICEILGEGSERAKLERLAKDLNIADTVNFLGNVPHEKIPEYLRRAKIFVRPSRSEGMGNSFVEALAAGLPIIGTPVGGILDVIEDRKTGLLARTEDSHDFAEKIEELFFNEVLVKHIVDEGQKMVREHFSWEEIADLYKKLFQSEFAKHTNLLIATPLYPPDVGGPATYTRLLEQELPRQGFRIFVVSFRNVKKFPKLFRHVIFFLKVLRKGFRADIIFAQDPVSVGLPAYAAARFLRKKFFLKVVGDYAWEQWQNKIQKSKFKNQNDNVKFKNIEEFQSERFDMITEVRRLVERTVAQRADAVIVPSNFLKKILLRWGVPEKRLTVIYNAFESIARKDDRAGSREKLGLQGFAVITAGRLVPWKGFLTLIRLMPRICEKVPDAKLYIIGDGPEFRALREEVCLLRIEETVILLGNLAQEKVFEYLAAGDVFLLNTAYEGHSHMLLEAMAFGIPVITTPVCGNPEIVEDRKNGLLVSYDDIEAIVRVLEEISENPLLGKTLSTAAEKKVQEFSVGRMIKETTDLLRNNFRNKNYYAVDL